MDVLSHGRKAAVVSTTPDFRAMRWLMYFFGGSAFLAGSIVLLPQVESIEASSLLYTSGSFSFVVMDAFEWFFTLSANRFQKTELFNQSLSLFASCLYLMGSLLFIPALKQSVVSVVSFFMVASLFVIVVQAHKLSVFRLDEFFCSTDSHLTNELMLSLNDAPKDETNALSVSRSRISTCFHLMVCGGAALYLFGSVFFLSNLFPANWVDCVSALFLLGAFLYYV